MKHIIDKGHELDSRIILLDVLQYLIDGEVSVWSYTEIFKIVTYYTEEPDEFVFIEEVRQNLLGYKENRTALASILF